MELIVGALVVLGFVAILIRFIARDATGEVRLPRIVDDSIGMWALRRITGRRLWERPWDDEIPADPMLEANAPDATRAAVGASAVTNASNPSRGPAKVAPTRSDASLRRIQANPSATAPVASSTPVADLRRRQQARPRRSPWLPRLAALGSVAAVLIVAVVALGAVLPRSPQGQVLDATGRPKESFQARRFETANPTNSPAVVPPTATITRLAKASIPGQTVLRLTLTWSITDNGSSIENQLVQWRIDDGPWTAIRRVTASTRTASIRVPRGHTYTFRVRATDRSGLVGPFARSLIRI